MPFTRAQLAIYQLTYLVSISAVPVLFLTIGPNCDSEICPSSHQKCIQLTIFWLVLEPESLFVSTYKILHFGIGASSTSFFTTARLKSKRGFYFIGNFSYRCMPPVRFDHAHLKKLTLDTPIFLLIHKLKWNFVANIPTYLK